MNTVKRRCCHQIKDTTRYLEGTNPKAVDVTTQINIGVFYHICYKINLAPADIKTRIIDNIKLSISNLNRDFNLKNNNFKYGQRIVNGLRANPTNIAVKNMYNNAIRNARSANITFTCMGYNYIPNDPTEFLQTHNDDTDSIDAYLLQNAHPRQPARFLNVWVVPMDSLLGYAHLPWDTNLVNGVVLNYHTFEKHEMYTFYNLGKTLTHEIGHWLGLAHTFENPNAIGSAEEAINYSPLNSLQERVGDCVIDTPPQKFATYGNPFSPKIFNWKTLITSYKAKLYCAMFVNYMDYSNDACLFLFTKDQVTKMRIFINKYKPKIISQPVNPFFDFSTGKINSTVKKDITNFPVADRIKVELKRTVYKNSDRAIKAEINKTNSKNKPKSNNKVAVKLNISPSFVSTKK